jgi:preprotein translocase subunit SecF
MRPLKLVPDNTNIDFLRWRWWAMGISIALIIASIALVAMQGLNWGADFSGGQTMRVSFTQKADVEALRGRIEGLGIADASIQESGDGKQVTIRIPLAGANTNPIGQCFGSNPLTSKEKDVGAANSTASKVRASILKDYPTAKFGSVESVSGKVSCELFSTGSIALSLAMFGIALFIWLRFEWQFGVGALFALFHDVVLTFGFFAVTQLEFNLNIVAAILTIIGYSLNDTIVTYDRVRENFRKWRKMDVTALLNLSVNETLSRTVVTSLSLILTLGILLAMGPEIIFGFTAAMFLGILIGTFSSVYVAAPILIWLNVRSDSFVPKENESGGERVAPAEGFTK